MGEKHGFPQSGFNEKYRCNGRIMVQSDELKNTIYSRIEPFLEENEKYILSPDGTEGIANSEFFHPNAGGKWHAKELNNLFRLCRYKPGGHFGPHRDGCY